MMLGMAIRMATDLNLHRKSMASGLDTEEGRARDLEVRHTEPALVEDPFWPNILSAALLAFGSQEATLLAAGQSTRA